MKQFLLYFLLILSLSGASNAVSQPSTLKGAVTKVPTPATNTTGRETTTPLVVSIIALISALSSVALSFKVKDKEYRNDYYKIVIGKRLKAVEHAEIILGLLSNMFIWAEGGEPGKNCHYQFVDEKNRKIYAEAIMANVLVSNWFSPLSEALFDNLSQKLGVIFSETEKLDRDDRIRYLTKECSEIETKKFRLVHSLNLDMEKLYDVPGFYKSKIAHTQRWHVTAPSKHSSSGAS